MQASELMENAPGGHSDPEIIEEIQRSINQRSQHA
eukprot:CAMPEP_0206190592 /NCGR_PEP_ID=MMETSP0166-20121206/4834_1 /ASSEMBLY_ACC=CAM_ASM_000260 /TAXON_ID=95228 /ORGANISM="Vannella robusta, Strain DIVA3 518/3/11/1/6" /LENGTH=34 /DNA_ID= /DNA_START= /DNA_END= /DNA_ORIENTATION=